MIQGPIDSAIQQVLTNYADSGIFDQLIYSGRYDQRDMMPSFKGLQQVYSSPPSNCGVGNRNIQITSTRAGLALVETDYVWKVRSDQILPAHTIKQIHDFIKNYSVSCTQRCTLHTHQQSMPVFVAGNYTQFPFHPRDHMFLGYTSDVRKVFDIPLDFESKSTDYSKYTRAETWIGANYIAKHNNEVRKMVANYSEFLVDNAPQIQYTLQLSNVVTPQLFATLPRIEFSWPKHGLRSYHYHVGESLSEYWHE